MSSLNRLLVGKTELTRVYLPLLLALALGIAAIVVYVRTQEVPIDPISVPSPSPSTLSTTTPSATPTITPNFTQSPISTSTPSPLPTTIPTPFVTKAGNWAGYIVSNDLQKPQSNVTRISGSWTVPAVAASTNNSYSAVWIGIGGQFDQTLIQCGTEQDFVGGRPVYSAWYELLPNRAIMIQSMTVSPGDEIEASIRAVNNTGDEWFISITDVTTGRSFQRNFVYTSTQLSAEWIIERPNVNGFLSQLADFGDVTFTNCLASIGGTSGGISNFPALKTVMYSTLGSDPNSVQLTEVSSLNTNGTIFTVSCLVV